MSEPTPPIDYLVIGHVTRDLVPGGYRPGGTVTFSGHTARALGCRTAVLTSARSDADFESLFSGFDLVVIPAAENTIFENVYAGNRRTQWLRGRAGEIKAEHVPAAWRRAAVVHLGPLTAEIDLDLVDLFPHSVIGVTPQGWMRRWGADGRVTAADFDGAEELFGRVDAVILSEEDLLDEAMLDRFIRWARILVLTQNYAGCTVYWDNREVQIPAPQIELVEPTGAGDIFAAAFLVRLWRNGQNPIEAAAFANHVAAHSVTTAALAGKVTAWEAFPIAANSETLPGNSQEVAGCPDEKGQQDSGRG